MTFTPELTPQLTARTTLADGTSTTVVVPRQRIPFDSLRSRLFGRLLEPHQADYEALVTPWNLAVPMRPAAVVEALDAQDVVDTVRFAAEHRLTVGVQATGHGAITSIAGHILVSTRQLDEVTVSPEGWARVGAGVKWARVIEAAAPYGFAPLNGSSSDVGVVGYTTGGGVGPMARTFGLAADRVRAFEVVTGDGVFRRVTPTEHPDLFFALRGGKGAAGIVTAVEFDMVRLPEFYGGAIYFDGSDAAAVIEYWRDWSARLPEQATTSFTFFQLPPLEFVPPQLAGKITLAVRFLWTAEPAEGERLLDEMRAVAPVILDDAALKPYTAVDSVHADPVDPMPVVERSMLLNAFPQEAADVVLAMAGVGSGSPQVMVEIRQLGGAYAQDGEHSNAFSHRAAQFSLLTVGMPDIPGTVEHSEALIDTLGAWDTGGVWPNFAPAHDPATAARAYSPDTLARLGEIARTYDPSGVLAIGGFTRTVTTA